MSLSISSSKRYVASVVLLTVFMVGGFIGATEWMIRTLVIPVDNLEFHKRVFFESKSATAAFGDSHFAYGLTGVEGTTNLAFPGDSLAAIEGKAELYLKDRDLDRVILQADTHLFAPYQKIENTWEQEARFDGPSSPLLWTFAWPHSDLLREYWTTMLGGEGFDSVFMFRQDGAQVRAGVWPERSDEERRISLEKRLNKHRPLPDPGQTESAMAYERLLQYFTARDIAVCMVAMPVTVEYREGLSAFAEHEAALQLYRELSDRYGARYVDMSDAISDPALFYDQDHLNDAGAAVFGPSLSNACFPT